ncbi:PorP/SprF family type IX secretion system membrane protein [bacterium SCSIO 12741]|nr:PorP/SprF family type IX secretion system membrane protein [bacterium SCSIO 12741]
MNRLAILLCFCLPGMVWAQQEPLYNLFWNNYSVYNPAASGLFHKHHVHLNGRLTDWGRYREQKLVNAGYDYRIDGLNSGIGINYSFNEVGFAQTQKLGINYAYQVKLKGDRIISAGVAGFYQVRVADWSAATFGDLYADPAAGLDMASNAFDMNLGVFYKGKHLWGGVSVTQLLESELSYYQNRRHLIANLTYDFKLGANWQIQPTAYLITTIDPWLHDYHFNVRTIFRKTYWIGATYRYDTAVAGMAGIEIKQKFRLNYAIDYVYNKDHHGSRVSQEIGLALMLKKKSS